jgi:23S rRNA (guanosine2251-2'-O)-methyltransferase
MVKRSNEAPILTDILALAAAAQVRVRFVSETELDSLARTEVPQGVIAIAEPVPNLELAELLTPRTAPAFLVVLDGVTDPNNVGALLRSALSAGVTGVVLRKQRAGQLTPSALKAAAGAVEYLAISLVAGIPQALAELSRRGVWTLGLDESAEKDLDDVEILGQDLALVLGDEGVGLSELTKKRCDVLASIELSGPISSLNVAAAGAIACFAVARQRRAPSR